MPTREDINRRHIELFKAKVAEALTKTDLSEFQSLVEAMAAENETSDKTIAAVLCSMVHKKAPAAKAATKDLVAKERVPAEPRAPRRTDRFVTAEKSFKRPDRPTNKKAEKNQKWRERVESKGGKSAPRRAK